MRKPVGHLSTERVYVKVTSHFDTTGYMVPQAIIWEDGRTFPIEAVNDFRPADERGRDCYSVVVQGRRRFLYFEKTDVRFPALVGRWFVEVEGEQK